MSTQKETKELDRIIIRMEPMQRLVSLLETLTALYEKAGLTSASARQAALADLECTFTVLPLAA